MLACYKCWCWRVTSVDVGVLQVLVLACYKCWCWSAVGVLQVLVLLCCCRVTSVCVAVLCAAGRRPLPPTDHRGADADPRLQRQTLPFQRLRCHRQLSGQFDITSVQVDME